MSNGTVLVTGGAGFIGSHVAEQLLRQGELRLGVRLPRAAGAPGRGAAVRPPRDPEFIEGDVRDRDRLAKALQGVDLVVHRAAEVGVGQSKPYQVSGYVDANISGTGVLLDIIANDKTDVSRIVVASSMSIYGEGSYRCPDTVSWPRAASSNDS